MMMAGQFILMTPLPFRVLALSRDINSASACPLRKYTILSVNQPKAFPRSTHVVEIHNRIQYLATALQKYEEK